MPVDETFLRGVNSVIESNSADSSNTISWSGGVDMSFVDDIVLGEMLRTKKKQKKNNPFYSKINRNAIENKNYIKTINDLSVEQSKIDKQIRESLFKVCGNKKETERILEYVFNLNKYYGNFDMRLNFTLDLLIRRSSLINTMNSRFDSIKDNIDKLDVVKLERCINIIKKYIVKKTEHERNSKSLGKPETTIRYEW